MSWLYKSSGFIVRNLCRLLYGTKVYGLENTDFKGPGLVVSNHISLLDPPILGAFTPFSLHYMAKSELFKNALFRALIEAHNAFPVKRIGFDRQVFKITQKLLSENQRILLFPEGTRQKDGVLAKGRHGTAKIALDNNVPVMPVCLSGVNHLRRLIFRKQHIQISYGKLIKTEDFEPDLPEKDRIRRLTEVILSEIKSLQDNLPTIS
jgi:1-acyl-sn-glycerol-3-phosphate acyltransferase